MTDILEEIAKFLFRFVFEILFSWTGEIVLFLISLENTNQDGIFTLKSLPVGS
jgi:hypothetical protein